jgi:DNA-binding transcriptional LysR family regulator
VNRFSDFDGLALFVRTVQAGGLAAAERATGVPKATLSRRLTALEATLNVHLARRTRKGLILTEEGQRLFARSRAALAAAEEAIAEVCEEAGPLCGRLRLSLPPDIATAVLAPALIRFKHANPGVAIEMRLTDRLVSLTEEGYDLVVRMGPLADSGLIAKKIASLPRLLVASPDFLADRPSLVAPKDIEQVPALAIRRDGNEWDLRSAAGEIAHVRPKVELAANRQTILVEAAVAGLGVANLPMFLVADALAVGALVPALPGWNPSSVRMTALWHRDRITERVVKAVVEAFVAAFPADGEE